MMRLTPLAIWAHKLSSDELFEAVKLQTYLTHPNEIAIHASYLYCYALKLILNGNTKNEDVYSETFKEAERMASITGSSSIKYWME